MIVTEPLARQWQEELGAVFAIEAREGILDPEALTVRSAHAWSSRSRIASACEMRYRTERPVRASQW